MLAEITEEQFDKLFALNTRGTLFTVQKALPLFREGGSIVLNGSNANLKAMPGLSVYSGSKAALRSFAPTWVMELISRQIRVNVLSPGPIDTAIFESTTGTPSLVSPRVRSSSRDFPIKASEPRPSPVLASRGRRKSCATTPSPMAIT
jgi:NAD(P)-dependent dehydrogenase (short-subunit alcohol dehydrogenase family)